jgi:hypothetical protein
MLTHLAWFPARSFTVPTMLAGVECWRWLLADVPAYRGRLLSQVIFALVFCA